MNRTKLKPITISKQSYQQTLSNAKQPKPIPLDLSLLSNPFLKDQESYKLLQKELQLYNRRIVHRQITDNYQIYSYDRLFVVVCELANMKTQEDMIYRLGQTMKWWIQQGRMIKQRKESGLVKYKVDRKMDKVRQLKEKERLYKSLIVDPKPALTHQIRYNQVFDYELSHRTINKLMEIPDKRLSEYKRKIIKLADDSIEQEVSKYQDKVTYPRPKVIVPQQEDLQDINPQLLVQNLPENTVSQLNPEGKIEENIQDNPATVDPNDPNVNSPNQQQQYQDLGGFGQEPAEPGEQQQPQQVISDDKLAPKNRIYRDSIRALEQQEGLKKYTRRYVFHLGRDDEIQSRLEDKIFKKQQQSLQLKRQDDQLIRKANEWASLKSQLFRESEHNLEHMTVRYHHSYSIQKPQPKEMLKPIDEKKYGFFIQPRPQQKPFISLQTELPSSPMPTFEQQIRKDKLKTLKSKFATILNLSQTIEARETTMPSMCQVSPRRKDLSTILRDHSLQKERDVQLQEIKKIKQSLGKHRINLNIRSLAQALVPDCTDGRLQHFQSPQKMLPKNPFMTQAKKKKKKKK